MVFHLQVGLKSRTIYYLKTSTLRIFCTGNMRAKCETEESHNLCEKKREELKNFRG